MRIRSAASFLWDAVSVAAALGMLTLATLVIVVPRVTGAVPLTVLSGSMEPHLSPGDLVVVRPVAAERIHSGDVVTFQPRPDDPTLVTHRVLGVTTDAEGRRTFSTRGDANLRNDPVVAQEQVRGKVVYALPWVGHANSALADPTLRRWIGIGLVGYSLAGAVLALLDRGGIRRRRPHAGHRGAEPSLVHTIHCGHGGPPRHRLRPSHA